MIKLHVLYIQVFYITVHSFIMNLRSLIHSAYKQV